MSNNLYNELKNKVNNFPEKPGVYIFYDSENNILYIGKARNLKKRVSSYFINTKKDYKTLIVIKKINKIDYIIVETESDAFLLENNLIKKYKPKYNILLKDDKTYPWICIKNENFPRVIIMRKVINDGSVYFGPYSSAKTAKYLIKLFHSIYPLRICNYNLSDENIKSKKFKVCLEYHMKRCLGPCEGKITKNDYLENINQIKEILNGKLNSIIEYLELKMKEFANNYQFEIAEEYKNKIEILKNYKSRSSIVDINNENIDVFTFNEKNNYLYVNYLKIVEGLLINSYNNRFKLNDFFNKQKEEILSDIIFQIKEKFNSNTNKILVEKEIYFPFKEINILTPQNNEKYNELIKISYDNLKFYILQHENIRKEKKLNILQKLKEDLKLEKIPKRIECFDNSNLQGKFPVSSCVVFENGIPKKSEYRHFHIKSVKGINDFKSIEEVVYRRYKRLLEENKNLPDLIIIDGGKGQLNSAIKSLKSLGIFEKISIISIAKRLEEIYKPFDPYPLLLNKNSGSLKLIQQIRNEAHRFAICFHDKVRTKESLKIDFENLKGIGDKTLKKLLDKFGSFIDLEKASLEDLEKTVGKGKAILIYNYFHK